MKLVSTYKTGWGEWVKMDGDKFTDIFTGYHYGDYYNEHNGPRGAESRCTKVYFKDLGYSLLGGFVFEARMKYTGRKGTQNSDHASFTCPDNDVNLTMSAIDFSKLVSDIFDGKIKIVDGCITGKWKYVKKGSSTFIQLQEE